MARLDVYSKGALAASVTLKPGPSYTVGRDPGCEIVIADSLVSRKHFEVQAPGGATSWQLHDLGTDSGTRVDGVREVFRQLGDRAVILVGRTLLVFHAQGEGDAERTPPSWAKKAARQKDKSTEHLPPAQLAQVQANLHGRSGPHFLQRAGSELTVHQLDPSGVSEIGDGPFRIPLSRDGKKLRAQVEFRADKCVIKAAGLLGRIKVNGKSVGSATLSPGDIVEVRGVSLEYHPGVFADDPPA